MRLSSLLALTASSSTVPASRLPRPRLTCAHTPGGVELGSVGRQLDHGQPVGVRVAERVHRGAAVHVEVVPNQDDRGVDPGRCDADRPGLVRPSSRVRVAGPGVSAAKRKRPCMTQSNTPDTLVRGSRLSSRSPDLRSLMPVTSPPGQRNPGGSRSPRPEPPTERRRSRIRCPAAGGRDRARPACRGLRPRRPRGPDGSPVDGGGGELPVRPGRRG
jgi:hypothetical protein